MAQLHVNSTTAGTPTSPYDTWATAATTMAAAGAVAVAGDEVFVHPSHSETAAAAGIGWAGTPASPIRIVCGTPDTVSGITALQTTAIWGIAASGSTFTFSGSFYVYGLQFRMTGSSGSAAMTLAGGTTNICTFENCTFYYTGASGTINIGPTASQEAIITLLNCSFRYAGTNNVFRLIGNVQGRNLTVISSAATPTSLFNFGYASGNNSGDINIDGLDFSTLANTVKLGIFARTVRTRIANVRAPTGWGVLGSTPPQSADIPNGSTLELLNYGDGDTNHRYWIENKLGRSVAESTIKVNSANASGNSTGTYSKRMQSLASVSYPAAIYRGPPITKYVVADGHYKGVRVEIAYDIATSLNSKQFFIEVTARTVSGYPTTTLYSSAQIYVDAPSNLVGSSETWDGLTGTGPNGTTGWVSKYLYLSPIPILEDGWLTVTPCMSIPSFTLFMNDSFVLIDEGVI